jgi:two-component system sensor histidine kinase YesM
MLEPCDIRICIFAQEDDCVCQVRNKGPAPVDDLMEKLKKGKVTLQGNGIGLLNIDRRIKTVFGEQYGVVILRDQDKEETIVEARFRQKLLEE